MSKKRGKGWYGDSWRHSMARKGIPTAFLHPKKIAKDLPGVKGKRMSKAMYGHSNIMFQVGW